MAREEGGSRDEEGDERRQRWIVVRRSEAVEHRGEEEGEDILL